MLRLAWLAACVVVVAYVAPYLFAAYYLMRP
jgi:hypothetical protein